jgi:hypothetical protein
MSDDERELQRARRIGLNEGVYREINERILDLDVRFPSRREILDLVCECGDTGCSERIRLSREDYEALRADPRLFAVVPGHEEPDVEQVVDHGSGYHVVRKRRGEPPRVAKATDPRSG